MKNYFSMPHYALNRIAGAYLAACCGISGKYVHITNRTARISETSTKEEWRSTEKGLILLRAFYPKMMLRAD